MLRFRPDPTRTYTFPSPEEAQRFERIVVAGRQARAYRPEATKVTVQAPDTILRLINKIYV